MPFLGAGGNTKQVTCSSYIDYSFHGNQQVMLRWSMKTVGQYHVISAAAQINAYVINKTKYLYAKRKPNNNDLHLTVPRKWIAKRLLSVKSIFLREIILILADSL